MASLKLFKQDLSNSPFLIGTQSFLKTAIIGSSEINLHPEIYNSNGIVKRPSDVITPLHESRAARSGVVVPATITSRNEPLDMIQSLDNVTTRNVQQLAAEYEAFCAKVLGNSNPMLTECVQYVGRQILEDEQDRSRIVGHIRRYFRAGAPLPSSDVKLLVQAAPTTSERSSVRIEDVPHTYITGLTSIAAATDVANTFSYVLKLIQQIIQYALGSFSSTEIAKGEYVDDITMAGLVNGVIAEDSIFALVVSCITGFMCYSAIAEKYNISMDSFTAAFQQCLFGNNSSYVHSNSSADANASAAAM
eukprot:GEZU01043015.1.p1 GENE.GEZU01043015.1~~GEZU01043015.1.p1  ORF type:complete len:305 (+),score=70.38 GEZU01043015.1:118-1032(+)